MFNWVEFRSVIPKICGSGFRTVVRTWETHPQSQIDMITYMYPLVNKCTITKDLFVQQWPSLTETPNKQVISKLHHDCIRISKKLLTNLSDIGHSFNQVCQLGETKCCNLAFLAEEFHVSWYKVSQSNYAIRLTFQEHFDIFCKGFDFQALWKDKPSFFALLRNLKRVKSRRVEMI